MKIDCGCGRTMALDSLRGPGAYRCGCGVRVKVTAGAPPLAGCMAPGCRATAIVATSGLARLCAEHDKDHMLEILPRVLAAYPPHTWLTAFAKRADRLGPADEPPPEWALDRSTELLPNQFPRDAPLVVPGSVVYFLRVGDKVKIGTALRLASRMEGLNPPPGAEVVLTLPGAHRLETQMHHQFADERHVGTEWFDLSPRLEEFIKARAPKAPLWARSKLPEASP